MTLGMETVYSSLQKHLDFSMSYTTFIEPLTFWGFAHLKSKKHGGSAHFSAHINPELSIQRFPMTPAEACRRRFPRALQRCSPQWSIVDPVLSVLEHIFEYMRHFWEHMANIINIYIRNHMANIIWFHVEYIYIYIRTMGVFHMFSTSRICLKIHRSALRCPTSNSMTVGKRDRKPGLASILGWPWFFWPKIQEETPAISRPKKR